VHGRCGILIVSDRKLDQAEHVAIPALLATSAVHQHLVTQGLRTRAGLVVETGSARETHHFACLPATAPKPCIPTWRSKPAADGGRRRRGRRKARQALHQGVGKGLLKVMSKMGISTYMSYTGAQIFEAIGLQKAGRQVLHRHLDAGRRHRRVRGHGRSDPPHKQAFGDDPVLADMLDAGGEYAFRVRGEEHMWTPDAIAKLQHSTRSGKYDTYKEYAKIINDQTQAPHDAARPVRDQAGRPGGAARRSRAGQGNRQALRHRRHVARLDFDRSAQHAGDCHEPHRRQVEYRRRRRGPGALQAGQGRQMVSDVIGKSRIERDYQLKEGDSLRSAIKQVASGRFGVTAEYLVNADQIQIKMAQGAKPGEGGQLPGHKVSEYIGFLRHSVPGVGLISPPPHHDIYSIEDLAQLIHDLKNANPKASISVKLVSEVGVGTVAAGVAKAKADHLVIAGHDGGTGASPLSSIKHAGTPWELGLAETQQTLVLNRLRGRVRVQVDGQMKTGRDVSSARCSAPTSSVSPRRRWSSKAAS
jgi:glutamate synthase (NADPH/NADH) large chain